MMRDRDNKGRFVASMHCQYDDDRKEKMDKNYANYGELYEYKRKPSIQIQNDDLVFTIHGITGYFLWMVLLFLFCLGYTLSINLVILEAFSIILEGQ